MALRQARASPSCVRALQSPSAGVRAWAQCPGFSGVGSASPNLPSRSVASVTGRIARAVLLDVDKFFDDILIFAAAEAGSWCQFDTAERISRCQGALQAATARLPKLLPGRVHVIDQHGDLHALWRAGVGTPALPRNGLFARIDDLSFALVERRSNTPQ